MRKLSSLSHIYAQYKDNCTWGSGATSCKYKVYVQLMQWQKSSLTAIAMWPGELAGMPRSALVLMGAGHSQPQVKAW